MKKNKKIAIIGHFGGDKIYLNGQTIKTQMMFESLKRNTDWIIDKIDTELKKRNPLKLFLISLFFIHKYDDIFLMTSSRGTKMFLPFLFLFMLNKKHKVYYIVTGGSLGDYIRKHQNMVKTLKKFEVIWVQTKLIKNDMEVFELNNIDVLPNFKFISPLTHPIIYNDKSYIKFCIFSRIAKSKGITEAVLSISKINDYLKKNNNLDMKLELDVYGAIETEYNKEFQSLLETYNFVKYCGIIEQKDITKILSRYFCVLFPTHWVGEGFPATILDSYLSGVPVIATDWNSNKEVLINGKTGLIYPSEFCKTIDDAILFAIEHFETMNKMRFNCLTEAKKYNPNSMIRKVIDKVKF